jgi:hypothetical protein
MRRSIVVAAFWLLAPSAAMAAGADVAEPGASPGRPSVLIPMYALSFALQGYDAYSTTSIVTAGGRELNPVMNVVVKSPAAFTTVKLGAAVATCVLSEHLWRSHHRAAAVALMTATNIGLSLVAVNNAHILSSIK